MSIETIKKTRRPDQGCLFIWGPQAQSFLQGQLTCDVTKCPTFGGYCNIQGRLISIFHLSESSWQEKQGYWLECPLDILDATLGTLKKHALFSKVSLENTTDLVEVNNEKSLEHYKSLDILSKIPQLTSKTQGLFLAHHLNLPDLGAVSFNKGCYLGQEIIARMQYRAKIKKHLAIFEYEPSSLCILEPGSPIYKTNASNEEPVGHIVNIAQPLILASILDEALDDTLRAGTPSGLLLRPHMRE